MEFHLYLRRVSQCYYCKGRFHEQCSECNGTGKNEVSFLSEFILSYNQNRFDDIKGIHEKKRVTAEEYFNSDGLEQKYGDIEITFDGLVEHLKMFAYGKVLRSKAAELTIPSQDDWKKIEYDHIDWFFEKRKQTSSDEEFLWFKARMIKWFEEALPPSPQSEISIWCEMEDIKERIVDSKDGGEYIKHEYRIKLNPSGQPIIHFKS